MVVALPFWPINIHPQYVRPFLQVPREVIPGAFTGVVIIVDATPA
jgi:hypothetical protein